MLQACLKYLYIKGIWHYRNNTGAVRMDERRFVRFGVPGGPDIVAVIRGQYVGIECKAGKGRQNDNQKLFQAELERAGGRYILVRTLDDLVKALS